MLVTSVAEKLIELTRSGAGFLHFDSIGFLRLAGDGTKTYLENLNSLFNTVRNSGGRLYLPVFSYSYTRNEIFDMEKTPTTLGRVAEHLRQKNPKIRTSDALFSYLAFDTGVSDSYFLPNNYESFGKNSLIGRAFDSNAYLLSVGGKLDQCTEVHFLEKLLNVGYRVDKDFTGKIVTPDGVTHDQTIRYFCRDLEFASKHGVTVSFTKFFSEMDASGLIEKHDVGGEVLIEGVRFQCAYDFLAKKLSVDPFYLMKPVQGL